jgi:hypothetical protein
MANTRLIPKGEGTSVMLAWLVSRSELGVDYLRKTIFFIIFILLYIIFMKYIF